MWMCLLVVYSWLEFGYCCKRGTCHTAYTHDNKEFPDNNVWKCGILSNNSQQQPCCLLSYSSISMVIDSLYWRETIFLIGRFKFAVLLSGRETNDDFSSLV